MDTPVIFIGTVQVAITVFSIAMGAIGQPLLTDYFDAWIATTLAYAIAFLILTYLSVTLGELVPKAIALQRAEALAIVLAYPTALLALVARPLVWLLQVSAIWVTRLFGVESSASGMFARTREDVRLIVAEAGQSGVVEGVESDMLYGAFKFADKEVHDVMVPRPEVVAISVELPPEECLAAVIDSPYTRYPAYRNSLDEILGILHVRDLFKALYSQGIENVEIEKLLRKPYVVPETKDLAALLAEFRKTNQHMAIVVDEYGSMEGIVTLEDLLEEIVGEIEDEYDLPDESIERVDDRTIRIDGTFPDRRFQRAIRALDPRRGLPHDGRFRVRLARPRAGGRRLGGVGRAEAPGARGGGLSNRPAHDRLRGAKRGASGRSCRRRLALFPRVSVSRARRPSGRAREGWLGPSSSTGTSSRCPASGRS